jgi:hypothetical protein
MRDGRIPYPFLSPSLFLYLFPFLLLSPKSDPANVSRRCYGVPRQSHAKPMAGVTLVDGYRFRCLTNLYKTATIISYNE